MTSLWFFMADRGISARAAGTKVTRRLGAILGALCGLLLTIGIAAGGIVIYRNHQALRPIEDAHTAPATPPPSTAAAVTMPTKDIWAPGSWEADADRYMRLHAYDTVSSATPPQHRHHRHKGA